MAAAEPRRPTNDVDPAASAPGPGEKAAPGPPVRTGWRVRVEDWVLVGWMALVAPALASAQPPSHGLFEPGRPAQGLLGLAGIAGAVVCLAVRRPPASGTERLGYGALGPFVGGLLLVVFDTVAALGLPEPALVALVAAVAVAAGLARFLLPAPSALVRRALVMPYVLVSGNLFWAAITAVTSGGDLPAALRRAGPADPGAIAPVAGFLLAFSAVYYAMLVYAPRQVAEREGGPVAWLVRYGLFVAGVLFGVGWLATLGG